MPSTVNAPGTLDSPRRRNFRVMLATLATLCALVSGLLLLGTLLSCNMYLRNPPSGPDAMGLIIPFATSVGSGLLGLIAVWFCIARGGLDWVSVKPMVPLAVGTAVGFGVGLATFGAFLVWAEKYTSIGPVVLIIGGGLGPALFLFLVLVFSWSSPASLTTNRLPQYATPLVILVALAGYAFGAAALWANMKMNAENNARAMEAHRASQAEQERQNALTPVQRLQEDLAACGEAAPLWVFVSRLPSTTDPEFQQIIVDRSLLVPDLDAEVHQTLRTEYAIYRFGAAEFVRLVPNPKREWVPSLVRAIERSGESLRDPSPADADVKVADMLRSLAGAAARFAPDPDLARALQDLRDAVAAIGDDELARAVEPSLRSTAADLLGR